MDNFFAEMISGLWQPVAALLRAFSPLLTGLVLAYVFNGPVEWIRIKVLKMPQPCLSSDSPKGRTASVIITYLLALIVICAVVYAFAALILGSLPVGRLSDVLLEVGEYFRSAFDEIRGFIVEHVPRGFFARDFDPESALSAWFQKHFSFEKLLSSASSFAGGAADFFIGLVVSVYLLKDKEFFLSLWQKFLSLLLRQEAHGRFNEVMGEINQVVSTFIKGAVADSLIVALLSSVALSAIDVRFSVVLGIMCGLLNVIPYFGPVLGMAPVFLSAFFFGGIKKAVFAVVLLMLIQQIDSNYVYPKVVGSSIGLHPLFVLLALTVLGHFFGIPGMLLAVPAAGILQVLVRRWGESR